MEQSPLHPRTLAEKQRAARLAKNRQTLQSKCAAQRIPFDTKNDDLWDNVCSLCLQRGDLVLCETEGCYLSAHAKCLGLSGVPSGAFHCPFCTQGAWPADVLPVYPEPLNLFKFHFQTHARLYIRLFGALKFLRVDHLEAYHKLLKRLYRLCNKSTDKVDDQIAILLELDARLQTLKCYYKQASELNPAQTVAATDELSPSKKRRSRLSDPETRSFGVFRKPRGIQPRLDFALPTAVVTKALKQLADVESLIVPGPYSGAFDDEETDGLVIGEKDVRQVQRLRSMESVTVLYAACCSLYVACHVWVDVGGCCPFCAAFVTGRRLLLAATLYRLTLNNITRHGTRQLTVPYRFYRSFCVPTNLPREALRSSRRKPSAASRSPAASTSSVRRSQPSMCMRR